MISYLEDMHKRNMIYYILNSGSLLASPERFRLEER